MPNARPVGPYQSLREALVAELDAGRSLVQAARAVNEMAGRDPGDRRTYNYASALQSRANQMRPVAISLRVPARVFGGLSARAAERGISPAALAHQLIEVAVRDSMIDAILDDGGEA